MYPIDELLKQVNVRLSMLNPKEVKKGSFTITNTDFNLANFVVDVENVFDLTLAFKFYDSRKKLMNTIATNVLIENTGTAFKLDKDNITLNGTSKNPDSVIFLTLVCLYETVKGFKLSA